MGSGQKRDAVPLPIHRRSAQLTRPVHRSPGLRIHDRPTTGEGNKLYLAQCPPNDRKSRKEKHMSTHSEPCRLADRPEDYARLNLERRRIQQWRTASAPTPARPTWNGGT